MALPPDFPMPPKRPPPKQSFLQSDGTVHEAWLKYFEARDRFDARVRQKLDTV